MSENEKKLKWLERVNERYKCNNKMEVITTAIVNMMNDKVMEVLSLCGERYSFDAKEAYDYCMNGEKEVKKGRKVVGKKVVGKKVVDKEDREDKRAEDLIAGLMSSDEGSDSEVVNNSELTKETKKKSE